MEEAIGIIETAELAVSITGGYITPIMFALLGSLLTERFKHSGSMDDLDRAINVTRNAIDAPHDTPLQVEFSLILGDILGVRFKHTGSMDDLNEAISIFNNAVEATPHDDPFRVGWLNKLGVLLGRRFSRLGLIDDLNQAIKVSSDAIDATPHDDLDRAFRLHHLGNFLYRRFDHIGLMHDLDRAIIATSNALDAIPDDHPDRAGFLASVGSFLAKRFERTESMSHINEAIRMTSHAVDATPYNHSFQGAQLHNLSTFLDMRFEKTGPIEDLNRSVVAAASRNLARPHLFLTGLGKQLFNRSKQTGSMDDLERSISVSSDAVDVAPHYHLNRADYLVNLANILGWRYHQLGSADDLDRKLACCIEGWLCINGATSTRFNLAQVAANILIKQQDWETSYQLLHDATSLLSTMSLRSLNHTDTQALLGNTPLGFATSAAAVALNVGKSPGDALRLLELRRGVTASLLMDMREDVAELQLKHPDLAERFSQLREDLDSPAHKVSAVIPDQLSSWEQQSKRRREADEELNKIIDEIRTRPEFSQFLQPPALQDLMNAAKQGPIIVVNITSFRSDAFLIQSGSIRVIELPGITPVKLLEQVMDLYTCLDSKLDLTSSLEWLWHTICRPCLDALGFIDPVSDGNWPHVWWIPTGRLSLMPLHAAGIYTQASKETVLDRVISSYASSIKALLHGRKRSIQKSSQAASLDSSALIVAMQDTPGLGQDAHLHFANAETDMLQDLLCPKLHLTPCMPQRRKDDVLEQLPKCKLFHFAGHGRLDYKDPSQSCLLLEDWETNPLTMGAVRDSRLQDNPPFLAYLSACSTGANRSAKLADEGIHLISAFQLAGFQHVVGTLWEVSDKHCVDVARILYKTLQEEGMTDKAVSLGLHRAIRALRDGKTEENTEERDATLARRKPEAQRVVDFLWVPYIHFGI